MFKRILVHLTSQSDEAWLVSRLAPLAAHLGAHVELFTCGYNRSLKHNHMFDKEGEVHAEHSYVKQCENRLEKLTPPLAMLGVEVGVDACWDSHTVDGILQKAERYDADLIIVELKEHSLLERVFGEMEADLARRSSRPVLMMRDREWAEQPLIAAGVDPFHEDNQPHPLDHQVLVSLANVTESLSATPRVLHSIHTLPHAAIFDEHVVTDYNALKEHVSEEHHAVVDTLVKQSPLADETPIHYLSGEAHVMLPRYALENELDLMILGFAEHSRMDRLLSNDMVARIMDDMPCDLLVVK